MKKRWVGDQSGWLPTAIEQKQHLFEENQSKGIIR